MVEEAVDVAFWLEMIKDANIHHTDKTVTLLAESMEILKIVSKSRKTLKDKKEKQTNL